MKFKNKKLAIFQTHHTHHHSKPIDQQVQKSQFTPNGHIFHKFNPIKNRLTIKDKFLINHCHPNTIPNHDGSIQTDCPTGCNDYLPPILSLPRKQKNWVTPPVICHQSFTVSSSLGVSIWIVINGIIICVISTDSEEHNASLIFILLQQGHHDNTKHKGKTSIQHIGNHKITFQWHCNNNNNR